MAFFLNEDYENFMAFHDESEMCEEGLRQQVRDYYRGQTKGIFFNVNAQRAYYNSKVYDPVWKNVEQNEEGRYIHRGKEFFDKPLPTLSNTLRAKMLYENVGNPFPIRLDESRKLGGLRCLTMRLNDCHLSNYPESPMHSDFWYEHPEWRLDIWRSPNGSGLNYCIKEVREYAKVLIRELFEIYDMDILELDWMRTPPFFPAGCEEEGKEYLNEIVAFASAERAKAKERLGHEILLSVRIPSRPEEALLLGLDVGYWADQKYVDMVVPCAFIGSTDGELPLEVWRRFLGKEVKLVPGMDILTCPHSEAHGMHNVAEFVYGYAANFFYQGAEDIYLFNHMDRKTGLVDKEAYRKLLTCVGEKETVEKCFRRHVATMVQNLVPGLPYRSSLPLGARDWWQFVRIGNGGGVEDREITLLFAFESEKTLTENDFEFVCNEVACPVIQMGSPLELSQDNWQKIICKVPRGVVRPGSSVLGFRAKSKDFPATLHWCEIDIAEAK